MQAFVFLVVDPWQLVLAEIFMNYDHNHVFVFPRDRCKLKVRVFFFFWINLQLFTGTKVHVRYYRFILNYDMARKFYSII